MLGFNVMPWEILDHNPTSYLNDLTNLAVLEEVYIHSDTYEGYEGSDTILDFSDPNTIPWNTNWPCLCPKLRIFGLHDFTHHDGQGFEPPPPYRPYRIENVLGEPLPDVAAMFTGIEVRSLLTVTEIDISWEEFDHLAFPDLEALSITLRIQEMKSEILAWVGSLTSLTQLSLYNKEEDPSGVEQYESLGRELALANNRLRYLKIDDFAWRVWHDHDEMNVCYLERLDRFECREVQGFQPRRRFHVTRDE
jgi:hypothetical protein